MPGGANAADWGKAQRARVSVLVCCLLIIPCDAQGMYYCLICTIWDRAGAASGFRTKAVVQLTAEGSDTVRLSSLITSLSVIKPLLSGESPLLSAYILLGRSVLRRSDVARGNLGA